MRTIWFCVATLLPVTAGSLSERSGQVRPQQLRMETARGAIAVEGGDARADIVLTNGKPRPGQVVAVYDRTSGLFWWKYETLNPRYPTGSVDWLRSAFTFYLTDNAIVSFSMLGATLAVRSSAEHASGLQDALDKALAFVAASRSEIENGTLRWATLIDLSGLGNEFFRLKGNAATLNPARVVSVSRHDRKWDILVQGPNQDSVIVTLDESYALLGIRPANR
jgi:hypothetical protein